MKTEHRKYILQHCQHKTAKQIATHLKIKERTVQRFIDTQQQKFIDQQQKETAEKKEQQRLNWWFILIVAIVGFLVYANALHGEFIWDDNILVRNNADIRDWGNLKKVVFGNLGGETLYYKHSSFRPVQTVTYMLDYSLWQLNPFGYHLTNIICHLLVAICLYLFVFKLFANNLISLIAAALFVLHPTHTEAVTYISGRADPLSVIFMLSSLIFYFRLLEKETFINYLMMTFFYIFGILSRENALMVPLFVFVYHLAMKKKFAWKPVIVYGLIAGIYIFLRVNEIVGGMGLKEPIKTSILERIPGFFVAFASYMRILIAPFNLHMEYLRPMFSMSHPLAIIGGILFFASVFCIIYFRNRISIVSFGLLWFLAGLFPVANVFVVVNAYMAEHWLYVPSMGLFLLLAYGANALIRKNKTWQYPVLTGVTILGVFWGFLTFQQNKTWLNQIEFYERTREFAPNSGRLHADLGEAYYRVGRVEDARRATIRAIQLRPTYYAAYSNLGTIYVRMGKPKEAIEAYQNSLKIRPTYFNAHFNLANVYKDQAKYDLAIQHYELAIKYMPSLANAYNNMAICYNHKAQREKTPKKALAFRERAIAYYKQGIAFDPKNVKFYNNLASVLSDLGRHREAVDLYSKALQLKPNQNDEAILFYNLALGYYRLKDTRKAETAFQSANNIPLRSPALYQRLALIYQNTGLTSQAKILMNKAKAMSKQK